MHMQLRHHIAQRSDVEFVGFHRRLQRAAGAVDLLHQLRLLRGVEIDQFDRALQVVSAAARWLRESGHHPGVVGYCWGGSLAFLANTRLRLPAVSYYGARTMPFIAEPAQAPLMFHFGGHDRSTPAEDIARHRELQPQAQVFVYADADHAFNRDVDPRHFHAASAALASERTLAFLAEHTS